MSPWWREQLRVSLGADRVSVQRRSRGPRRRERDTSRFDVAQTADAPEWRPAVGAFFAAADAASWRGADLEIILSGHFVRYLALPWVDNLSAQDMQAYAQHQMQAVFGADAGVWSVCVGRAATGQPRIAGAIETALLDELRAQSASRGFHLNSLRPLLDAAVAALPAGGGAPEGWLAVVEPGRLSISRLERGHCVSVRSAAYSGGHEGPLLSLLEQDALCTGVATQKAKLYLQSAVGLNCDVLRARGWQVLPSVLQ